MSCTVIVAEEDNISHDVEQSEGHVGPDEGHGGSGGLRWVSIDPVLEVSGDGVDRGDLSTVLVRRNPIQRVPLASEEKARKAKRTERGRDKEVDELTHSPTMVISRSKAQW